MNHIKRKNSKPTAPRCPRCRQAAREMSTTVKRSLNQKVLYQFKCKKCLNSWFVTYQQMKRWRII